MYKMLKKIILTFIDTHDFTGKTIIPFCTSGSSPVTQSVEDLRKYDSKLTVLDGKRFAADSNDKAYESFVITNNSSNE